ncbi:MULTISPECIES: AbiJ-NTD4 domain-containing protein [Clostridia]|jgi:hypothetical protein|uniref:AbiJ-NTD4 domain-containing protein n=1 Tax=Clostridia TaxID=186801 RepID=UPI000E49DD10|nr:MULTISPECIES: hypothetical protein [Clostridia]RHV68533.1 hypothetical protein DXB15_10830 [Roseburia sp. OM02-15]
MHKVSRRGGFSDRNGIKPENIEIQLKDFDKRTRVQLQNMINNMYAKTYNYGLNEWDSEIQEFFRYVLGDIYAEPTDVQKRYYATDIFLIINNTINKDSYDEVLTVIEALVQYWDSYMQKWRPDYYIEYYGYVDSSLYEEANEVFEKEYIGYRFIDEKITPISDKYEVAAVNEALQNIYQPVREHISKANSLLADRENPDYENSIKESISAVEAICEIITGESGTLGKLLTKVEQKGVYIHSALQSAYKVLYGYTSDASGIRHARKLGGVDSTFAEAKYMLVACSAFVNYLMTLNAD